MTFIYPQFNWGFTHAFSADKKTVCHFTLFWQTVFLFIAVWLSLYDKLHLRFMSFFYDA